MAPIERHCEICVERNHPVRWRPAKCYDYNAKLVETDLPGWIQGDEACRVVDTCTSSETFQEREILCKVFRFFLTSSVFGVPKNLGWLYLDKGQGEHDWTLSFFFCPTEQGFQRSLVSKWFKKKSISDFLFSLLKNCFREEPSHCSITDDLAYLDLIACNWSGLRAVENDLRIYWFLNHDFKSWFSKKNLPWTLRRKAF